MARSEEAEIRARRGAGEGEERGEEPRDGGGDKARTSTWEWVVAGLSGLLVLGAIAFMLYDGLVQPSTPPRIELTVDTIVHTGMNSYLVEFAARNNGQQTAAGLVVEGELVSDTGTVEKAQVTIDYVPAQSRRRAGLIFHHDPRLHALELRPKGYDRP